jgi:hypothetical protein
MMIMLLLPMCPNNDLTCTKSSSSECCIFCAKNAINSCTHSSIFNNFPGDIALLPDPTIRKTTEHKSGGERREGKGNREVKEEGKGRGGEGREGEEGN